MYSTPEKFWRRTLLPVALFEDETFQPGQISDVQHTGTGLGSIELGPRSNPRGTYSLRVQVAAGGELPTEGVINVASLPRVKISLDGGVTYSRTITPDANGRIPYVDGGFDLILKNGAAGSSVTIGTGDAALVFTPLQAGITVSIKTGTKPGYNFYPGSARPQQGRRLDITVTGTDTAAQVASSLSYTSGNATLEQYVSVAYGGAGTGAVLPAGPTPLPYASFVASDTFSAALLPSPDILEALQWGGAKCNGYLRRVYNLPLRAWNEDLEVAEEELARWRLISRKGQQDKYKNFDPVAIGTMKYLEDVGNGQVDPGCTETPPGVSFATMVPAKPVLDGSWPI